MMKRMNLKKNAVCILGAMMMLAMPSCQTLEDEPTAPVYEEVDWATVKHQDKSMVEKMTVFDSDSWGQLLPRHNYQFGDLKSNQRVILYFNLVEGVDDDAIFQMIEVGNVVHVLTKDVEQLTDENDKEFGNDPVSILQGDIWLGGGHLNVIFQQNRPAQKKHRVSLVARDFNPDQEGYLNLEFRYNDYDDTTNRYQYGVVSYSLHGLNIDEQTKGIRLKLNSAVNGQRVVELKFGEEGPSSSDHMRELKFSKILVK